ncbi:MAG: A/G-specific adenine glycosylase [Prolixibacteraceae bacterium]|nr:A/G-specific adenine glycosylase [Prolixibacteraceae bacterium]
MEGYRKALTVWYNHTKRDLPWRDGCEPYHIWVSEVILQQTRIQQGTDYYHNFLRLFPDVPSLANAPEVEVLKAWQGLGYYSRARNMHHAAKTIQNSFNGIFPADYHTIKKLKGIGDYTAAAIASIAFGLPYAVVDGNVYRVLSRLFGISTAIDSTAGRKEFYRLAQLLLDPDRPGDSNQAIMELGAIQCLPSRPLCPDCPLHTKCFAYENQCIDRFPVKSKKTKQKERYLNFIYLHDKNNLFLEKRNDKDIWRNLFQFPVIETTGPSSPEEVITSLAWKELFKNTSINIESVYPEKIHLLTHQRLHIRFYSVKLESNSVPGPGHWIAVEPMEISKYPVPKPVENFLMEMGH